MNGRPDEIRKGLTAARMERERGDQIKAKATRELVKWLRVAHEERPFSFRHAAELGGVTRGGAYQLRQEGDDAKLRQ